MSRSNSVLCAVAGVLWLLAWSPASSMAAPRPHEPASDRVVIGWTAWADDQFVTQLAQRLIENNTNLKVSLVLASIARQYRDVAAGRLDVMMMAWLPDTHARYWKRYRPQVVDLGTLYDGARIGLAVPDYVPPDQLASIADLARPAVQAHLHGVVQGIDPGAGEMALAQAALKSYGLAGDYRLQAGDEKSMVDALGQATARQEWIVVTAWTPHWIFARWPLRFLTDPNNAMGAPQHVDVIARRGFASAHPFVAAMLSRMHIPMPQLQAALDSVEQNGYDYAVTEFIDKHPEEVAAWLGRAGDNP